MHSTLVKKVIAKEKKAFYQENVKVEANNHKKMFQKEQKFMMFP